MTTRHSQSNISACALALVALRMRRMVGQRIAYSHDLALITMMTATLEDADLTVYPLDQANLISLAGADLGWYITVPAEESVTAIKILSEAGYRSSCLVPS